MRRLLNFLGVIALGGLVFALAPSTNAIAGKGKSTDTSSNCGGSSGSSNNYSNNPACNCMPLTTFSASGNGVAVDDVTFSSTTGDAFGCYAPDSGDPFLLNDNPELACPTPATGSAVNLSCGCVIAGTNAPNGGQPVTLVGDAQHGNWTITQLEVSYAFGDNTQPAATFFIGNQNGTGAGTNGGRCFGASGYALLVSSGTSSGSMAKGQTAYLELQGTICDTIPLSAYDDQAAEAQKGSFTGSYIFDASRSSPYFTNYTGTGNFVVSIDEIGGAEPAYSDAQFSFTGSLSP